MFDTIYEMLSFGFIQRALIVGIAISLCASILGVTLVLKRYSMIGDGLSYVSFGAMAIAFAFEWAPLQFTIPIVLIAAFFLLKMSQNSKINADAAIALVSCTSIAIGVTVISLNQGLNANISSYMFGSILALTEADVWMSVGLSIVVLLLFTFSYNQIFTITFDENFSRATGVKVDVYTMILALLTSITIVLGMRLMGTMLISSLIIFPGLSAMQLFKTFKPVVIIAGIISAIAFFVGVLISFAFGFPPGAAVVLVNASIFLIFMFASLIIKRH
jgi:zinc transport system permease protein